MGRPLHFLLQETDPMTTRCASKSHVPRPHPNSTAADRSRRRACFLAHHRVFHRQHPDPEHKSGLRYHRNSAEESCRCRLGGLKGGVARAMRLSAKKRQEIARKGAMVEKGQLDYRAHSVVLLGEGLRSLNFPCGLAGISNPVPDSMSCAWFIICGHHLTSHQA